MVFNIPCGDNKRLLDFVKRADSNKPLQAYWHASNVMSIDRIGYNDHGQVHVKIVANIALRILRMLVKHGVKPSIVKDHEMKNEDAELVVVAASMFHDTGIAWHRDDHERYSVSIMQNILPSLLAGYGQSEVAVITAEVAHAILAHETTIKPATIEAGIVRIADALDMAGGRARIPFNAGSVNIHSVSALAVDKIDIKAGRSAPVKIEIVLNNPAGIFQVDELLKRKVKDSRIEQYLEIEAEIKGKTKKSFTKVKI